MVESPVGQSPFDKVIKAASGVKTKRGLVALNLVLLFLGFVFVLFLTNGVDRLVLAILVLVLWAGFGALAVLGVRQGSGEGER